MKILIVNANIGEGKRYVDFISSLPEISQISYSETSENALLTLLKIEPQILIISEDLLCNTNCDLVKSLNKLKFKVFVIVITRNSSFDLKPMNSIESDFIATPVSKEKIKNSLRNAFHKILEEEKKEERKRIVNNYKIRISTNDGYFLENLNTLAYCVASGTYTNIHLSNGNKIFSSYHLGRIEKVLKEHHFARVNRSVLVNLRMVKMIDKINGICTLDIGNESKEFKLTQLCVKNLELEKFV